jgi:hypothetical protein
MTPWLAAKGLWLCLPLFLIHGTLPAHAQDPGRLAVPPLVFSGLGEPDADIMIDALTFHGLGADDAITMDALRFAGLGDHSPPVPRDLIFTGLGGDNTAVTAESLRFEGWETLAADVPVRGALQFEGWGPAVESAGAQSLVFQGLGPERVRVDNFDQGNRGWTSNDGPGSLQIDRADTLCVWDNAPGTLTVQPPKEFLGDWGGPGGELSFRVYFIGATQWPVVITIYGPSGSAVVREALTSRGAQGFEVVQVYLDDIWWTVTGDWHEIIHDVRRVEIELDIKDGFDNANEACIDNFTLRYGHRS